MFAEVGFYVLFILSQDRYGHDIDQRLWRRRALEALGRLFGGATAYPKGQGVWRDDEQGGKLLFDEPIVVQCYTTRKAIIANAEELRTFLVKMGMKCRQGATAL